MLLAFASTIDSATELDRNVVFITIYGTQIKLQQFKLFRIGDVVREGDFNINSTRTEPTQNIK